MTLENISQAIVQANAFINSALRRKEGRANGPLMGLLLVTAICVLLPLDLSQLLFTLIGAIAYSILQSLQPNAKRMGPPPSKGKLASSAANAYYPGQRKCASMQPRERKGDDSESKPWRRLDSSSGAPAQRSVHRPPFHDQPRSAPTPTPPTLSPGPEVRKPSTAPIVAPTFHVSGWDGEIEEFLRQIMPTAESDRVVQHLVRLVKRVVRRTLPEVEVVGFTSGDLARGKAFGVAVPDVDIVINTSPQVLQNRLQGRLAQGRSNSAKPLDARKLQKSAIRVCTDKLVSAGGFKFRRSAFRGQEPKVTLLAPACLGISEEAIPVDFSVNAVTPFYNAALLTECGQKDPRAKALVLLVKRWAKDRGICHAPKGHLSPYLWTILSIYFLQVGVPDEGQILPPLEAFETYAGLMEQSSKARAPQQSEPTQQGEPEAETPKAAVAAVEVKAIGMKKSTGNLFKDFMHFYAAEFDWRNEAVCIRSGKRAPAALGLPLHIILHSAGEKSEVGPSIEDPFEPTTNLGSCMTATSMLRLREELKRADDLCASEASLTQLLEPWIPPEQGTGDHEKEDDEE